MTPNQVFVVFMIAVLLFIAMMIYLVFRSQKNRVECWQLIASRNRDGQERADIDKVGKVVALFVLTGVTIYYVAVSNGLDGNILLLLGMFLTYAGGIAAYAARLRAGSPPPEKGQPS